MRFGLCCLYVEEDISFKTTTAKALSELTVECRLEKVSQICHHKAKSLLESVKTVHIWVLALSEFHRNCFPE